MKPNYRSLARAALTRAEGELDSNNEHRVRYAALELRTAMEALVYERVLMYEDELSAADLAIWQPRQVFRVLLNIDEHADKTSSLSYGIQSSPGKPPEAMTCVGTDRVLSTRELKQYYDKLGSFLHAPTVQQASLPPSSPNEAMRQACSKVRDVVKDVLASQVFCINIKQISSIVCQECRSQVICRVPYKAGESREVECTKCPASYLVTAEADNTTSWHPLRETIKCKGKDCSASFGIWTRDVQPGNTWQCSDCGGTLRLVISAQYIAPTH